MKSNICLFFLAFSKLSIIIFITGFSSLFFFPVSFNTNNILFRPKLPIAEYLKELRTFDEKLNFSHVTNIEISFSFSNERKKQLDNCLSFLSNSLSYAEINSADKSQLLSLKLQLFSLPDGFDYINLAKLISGLHPNNIWLIPYKDIDNKFANEFLTLINESCEINMINIINFVGFDKEHLDKFITKQKNMIDMRICGKMGEEEMEFILNKYYDFLHDKENPEYKIKKLSLSGPINMNKKWNDLICKFLTLKQFEAFHLDCFFNEREFMREIAEPMQFNEFADFPKLRTSIPVLNLGRSMGAIVTPAMGADENAQNSIADFAESCSVRIIFNESSFEIYQYMDMDENIKAQNTQTIIKPIHIYRKILTKKKRETEIYGIPEDIDLQLLKKAWNKIFNTACSIKKDPKTNEDFMTLRGDHRQDIFNFLVEEGIGFKDNIQIHGGDL